MTPESQRIAIAEFFGWKADKSCCNNPNHWRWGISLNERNCRIAVPTHRLPDYLNDLNAMHEAERLIKETRRGQYNAELSKLASQRNLSSAIKEPQFIFNLLHATAAQRAEALLRTLNLWVETKQEPTK